MTSASALRILRRGLPSGAPGQLPFLVVRQRESVLHQHARGVEHLVEQLVGLDAKLVGNALVGLLEHALDLGGVSDPQAEIERRIERNGMAYLMKDGAVYAVVLSSDDYERLADKKA